MMHPVARLWVNAFNAESLSDLAGGWKEKKLLRLSRTWRKILRHTRVAPPGPILEAGCGWGAQMIPLAGRGYRVVGIDCSFPALREGKKIIRKLDRDRSLVGKVEQVCGDFLEESLAGRFQLVFHRGVLEHYLQLEDRRTFLSAMFARADQGGYVISIVPSGIHPRRLQFKESKLGGYNIPEIDYDPESLRGEAEQCGGGEVTVIPNNIMGYLNDIPAGKLLRCFRRAVYLFFQAVPNSVWGRKFREQHAYSFICIARKESG